TPARRTGTTRGSSKSKRPSKQQRGCGDTARGLREPGGGVRGRRDDAGGGHGPRPGERSETRPPTQRRNPAGAGGGRAGEGLSGCVAGRGGWAGGGGRGAGRGGVRGRVPGRRAGGAGGAVSPLVAKLVELEERAADCFLAWRARRPKGRVPAWEAY